MSTKFGTQQTLFGHNDRGKTRRLGNLDKQVILVQSKMIHPAQLDKKHAWRDQHY